FSNLLEQTVSICYEEQNRPAFQRDRFYWQKTVFHIPQKTVPVKTVPLSMLQEYIRPFDIAAPGHTVPARQAVCCNQAKESGECSAAILPGLRSFQNPLYCLSRSALKKSRGCRCLFL